jgi:hypothetical protein
MKLKFRVTNHGFSDEKTISVQLSGVDGTSGSLQVNRTAEQAVKLPVGAVVDVTISE